jgi:putative ABC transport system ATP-binding protein
VSVSYRNKYQTVNAVKRADCSFERGKAYAIVGKSGSGKTTLLSLLAGLELPGGGTILFDGKSTQEMDRDAYRRDNAAVIYQNYNLFPLLTVMENVLYSMKLKGVPNKEAKERAEKELAAVGITPDQFKRFPPQLSGGEQQRVAIARAVAKNPKLLLCDEPTGALDYATGKSILKLLQDACRRDGKTVLVITHNQALCAMADRVVKVRSGSVTEVTVNPSPKPVEEIEW